MPPTRAAMRTSSSSKASEANELRHHGEGLHDGVTAAGVACLRRCRRQLGPSGPCGRVVSFLLAAFMQADLAQCKQVAAYAKISLD